MSTVTEPMIARATQRWVIDPARSTAEFRVKHLWGGSTVSGRFRRFGGDFADGPDGRAIELTIDAGSVDTGNGLRDRHLRSADYFDAKKHPQVRFTANDVVESGNGRLHVAGDLEAAGRQVPLDFEVTTRRFGEGLELDATTTVDQRLFGMTTRPFGMIRAPSTLHVQARLAPADR